LLGRGNILRCTCFSLITCSRPSITYSIRLSLGARHVRGRRFAFTIWPMAGVGWQCNKFVDISIDICSIAHLHSLAFACIHLHSLAFACIHLHSRVMQRRLGQLCCGSDSQNSMMPAGTAAFSGRSD
jgi:hypothetical protein